MSIYKDMRKRRHLAPLCRKALDENELNWDDEAAVAAFAALKGKAAIYHCASRVVNREFIFKREVKDQFVRLMRRYEAFSQVKVLTFCVMSNHFHILVDVPDGPEDGGASWSDERVLEHLGLIYGEPKMAQLRWELAHYRKQGNEAGAEEFRERCFRRMWDLSQYMKILKQTFSQWFNREHGRRGVLWEERFKSELVEEGHAAGRVATYIDLNPVRARIVADPKDYRWSGYGEAVAGSEEARSGLRMVLFEEASTRMNEGMATREVADWREVMRRYRMLLFEAGEEHERDKVKNRAGIPRERVEKVLASGGSLSEAELGWCRTRYYLDGLVIGRKAFVNHVFAMTRWYFGEKRKSGARRMRRVVTSLYTMRDLQKDVLRC